MWMLCGLSTELECPDPNHFKNAHFTTLASNHGIIELVLNNIPEKKKNQLITGQLPFCIAMKGHSQL